MTSSMSKRSLLKIIIIGNAGVGKTSLLDQYVNRRFSGQYKATIGADFLTKEICIGQHTYILQLWDTAGQERFQSLGTAFYRGADACIIVYDISNPASQQNLGTWKDEFLIQSYPADPASFPFMVVANKVDLLDGAALHRAHSTQMAPHVKHAFEDCTNFIYRETSAKLGIGISEAMDSLIRMCMRVAGKDIQLSHDTIHIADDLVPEPAGCSC